MQLKNLTEGASIGSGTHSILYSSHPAMYVTDLENHFVQIYYLFHNIYFYNKCTNEH